MHFHRKWAFVSTLWAQKVADCVTLSSSLLVSRVSWFSLVRAASTTPASATSHLWWTVVDASSTGGPKATATGARPTLRRARHRREAVPANHVQQRWGLVRIYNKRKGKGWGNGRESPRGGRRALLSEPYITNTVGESRP